MAQKNKKKLKVLLTELNSKLHGTVIQKKEENIFSQFTDY